MANGSEDDPPWEPVVTVDTIHDGLPVVGIAQFHGSPHAYLSEYDAKVGDTGYFYLKPVTAEVYAMAMERWSMWLRWLENPAERASWDDLYLATVLPGDRERALALRQLIGDGLDVDPRTATRIRAQFREVSGYQQFVVRWGVADDAPVFPDHYPP